MTIIFDFTFLQCILFLSGKCYKAGPNISHVTITWQIINLKHWGLWSASMSYSCLGSHMGITWSHLTPPPHTQALNWRLNHHVVTVNTWVNTYMQLGSHHLRPSGVKAREFEYPAYSCLEFVRVMQLLDLCMLDIASRQFSSSVLAASAVYLVSERSRAHLEVITGEIMEALLSSFLSLSLFLSSSWHPIPSVTLSPYLFIFCVTLCRSWIEWHPRVCELDAALCRCPQSQGTYQAENIQWGMYCTSYSKHWYTTVEWGGVEGRRNTSAKCTMCVYWVL